MHVGAPLHEMDDYKYPIDFYGGIGGNTFKWVFTHKPDWVTYSRVWTKGTGQTRRGSPWARSKSLRFSDIIHVQRLSKTFVKHF